MKKFSIVVAIFLLTFYSHAQKEEPTLADSILLRYTLEEFRSMSPDERENAIRKLRGQEPLPPKKVKTHDGYGIKIVKDIPKEQALRQVVESIAQIEKEKSSYRQEVFPNSHVDVMNGFFGGFYRKAGIRELTDPDFKNYFTYSDEVETYKVKEFSNYSRRTYFFNGADEMKLIIIETGFNINEGETMYDTELNPYQYSKLEFYVDQDTLQQVRLTEADQKIKKDHHDEAILQIDRDTTKLHITQHTYSYFKNNCFYQKKKEGRFHRKEWKERLELLSENMSEECDNRYSALFKNYIAEYEEYKKGINQYLQPTDSSFLEVYSIPSDNDK